MQPSSSTLQTSDQIDPSQWPFLITSLNHHIAPLLSVLVASLFTGLVATWHGVNYFFDSSFYLWYAQRIQAGAGLNLLLSSYQSPDLGAWISWWPPLYPMFLAIGGDPLGWARVATVSLLVLTALLTYGVALRATEGKRSVAVAAALLLVSVPTVTHEAFAFARSETLFTALVMAVLWLMSHYQPGKPRPALYAAFFTALAMLTRYIGVALAFALIIYCVWRGWQQRKQGWRVFLPVLYFGAAFVPLGIYMLYLLGLTGQLTGSQPIHDSISLVDIPQGLRVMALQLLHGVQFMLNAVGLRSNWWALGAGGGLLVVIGLRGWQVRQRLGQALNTTHGLMLIYVVCYLLMLWSSSIRSVAIHADPRHFVPLYPVLAVFVVQIVAFTLPRYAGIGLLALYLASGINAQFAISEGLRHNDPRWQQNTIIQSLPDVLPEDTIVHSMVAPSLAIRIPTQYPYRTFGGKAAFVDHRCDDILYPPDYGHAAFVLVNAPGFRTQSVDAITDQYRSWGASCGAIERLDYDGFALLLVIALDG